MADDSVRVTPDSVNQATGSGVTAGKLVKTFAIQDLNGNTVEVQAVALVDAFGNILTPLSEATGQTIVNVLKQLDRKLALAAGVLPATDDGAIVQGI